jgi:hypothetical protein
MIIGAHVHQISTLPLQALVHSNTLLGCTKVHSPDKMVNRLFLLDILYLHLVKILARVCSVLQRHVKVCQGDQNLRSEFCTA